MYEHEGLQNVLFIMLYGGALLLAVVAAAYLWFRSGNAFHRDLESPHELRRWAAAFLGAVAASHVWWYVLGIHWLTDDRLVRNIVAITLDRISFVPLMMCILLRMLQDRRRLLWPVTAAMVPFVVVAVVSLTLHYAAFEWFIEVYSLLLGLSFLIYYVYAQRQYERWLRDNFVDLEHKELWRSLLLLACILLVYVVYTTNEGALATETLAQLLTLVIIGFVVWRVETLQALPPATPCMEGSIYSQEPKTNYGQVEVTANDEQAKDVSTPLPNREGSGMGLLLYRHCEVPMLYVHYDLTLTQLAEAIGTSREELNAWFAEQGENYNTYINRLRIDHFCHLHRQVSAAGRSISVFDLAYQCGYRSYSSFTSAFRQRMGMAVTEYVRRS